MEMERVTIELPIVKVEPNSPIFGREFASEHYENGLSIVEDGIMRHIVYWDGSCVCNCPCPHDVIEKYLVEKSSYDMDEAFHNGLDDIEARLDSIEKKVCDCLCKSDAVIDNFAEVRDDMLDIIEDKLGRIH